MHPRTVPRVQNKIENTMYEEHLKRLEQNFGKFLDYPDAEPLEKCILLLKRRKMTYKQIQKFLGNPSKETIKSTILKYEPELLNIDCNQHKLQSNKNQIEQRVIGLIQKYNQFIYDLDEFDKCTFNIVDNKITFYDEDKQYYFFDYLDQRTQLSILYNIARILNIDIKSTEFKPQQ